MEQLSPFLGNGQKTQYLFEVQSHNGFKVCVCVWLFHQGSRISQALVSPLRYPFISPEYHIVGADNWTWALFFYIQFKGKHFSHFQMARTTALKLQTCLYEHQSPVLLQTVVYQTGNPVLHPLLYIMYFLFILEYLFS